MTFDNIAVHPDRLAQGIGRSLTTQTVGFGFDRLSLLRSYLKVRDWHHGAILLYESVGFKKCGTGVESIQGGPTQFVKMEFLRPPTERSAA